MHIQFLSFTLFLLCFWTEQKQNWEAKIKKNLKISDSFSVSWEFGLFLFQFPPVWWFLQPVIMYVSSAGARLLGCWGEDLHRFLLPVPSLFSQGVYWMWDKWLLGHVTIPLHHLLCQWLSQSKGKMEERKISQDLLHFFAWICPNFAHSYT